MNSDKFKMTNNELLKEIAPPFGDLYIRKESFNSYKKRVSVLIPNFPENVLEQWLYRHFEFIEPNYLNLDLRKMQFTKEKWGIDKIYNMIKSFDGEPFDGMAHHVYETESWLSNYMLTELTWPNPIIVLENDNIEGWGKPYHLMEGHQRLDYFREIYRKEKNTLHSQHELWIVKLV